MDIFTPIVLVCALSTGGDSCATGVPKDHMVDSYATKAECEEYLKKYEAAIFTNLMSQGIIPDTIDGQCVSWGPEV